MYRLLIRKTFDLARPFGLKKLVLVAILTVIQGGVAMVGVSSIFPFLALASDPQRIYQSPLGRRFMEFLPDLGHNDLLIATGVLAIVLLFVSNITIIVGEFVRVRYSRSLGHWLRVRLLNHLIAQPYTFHLETNSAILSKKVFNDVNLFVQSVLLPSLDCGARIITSVFLIAALFIAEPTIASIAILFIGVFYGGLLVGLHRVRGRMSDGVKTATRGIFSTGQSIFGGIKPISVSGRIRYFIERFSAHSFRLSRIQTWLPVLGNSPRYLLEPLVFGGLVAVVVVRAGQGKDFVSLLPNLGVMALAAYRLLPNLQWIYGQLHVISTQRHALEEIHDEMMGGLPLTTRSAAVIESDGRLRFEHEIEFRSVSFQYQNAEKPILENVSFRIPRNAIIGVIGETGSGKSTLVDLILGLHTPSGGQVLIDGVPLETQKQVREWQNHIGYVPQDIFLLDESIVSNIAFGRNSGEIDVERVRRVAEMAQISEFIETESPDGYDTIVGERGVRLSGGQRQRIALARAFYHEPDVLLLDEATSALDSETEAKFMKVVSLLREQQTIIIIAHRVSTLSDCDAVFRVHRGRVERQTLAPN